LINATDSRVSCTSVNCTIVYEFVRNFNAPVGVQIQPAFENTYDFYAFYEVVGVDKGLTIKPVVV